MKIVCPSCLLTGTVNEVELPVEGRRMNCPRCKTGFHVEKPPLAAGNRNLMSICPVCRYSTFTDEMFAVCPKCGLVGDQYREKLRKQQEEERMRSDREALHRSYRNPELVMAPVGEAVPQPVNAPQPVRVTGWTCIIAGGALLCYGLAGLLNYYGNDWQAKLSEPLLEPISKTAVFFRLGFLPWLTTLFSICFILVATQFLELRSWAHRGLTRSAWAGLILGLVYAVADFVNWVRISSSSPSFSYIVAGIMSSLLLAAFWSSTFLALIRFLRKDSISIEFTGKIH